MTEESEPPPHHGKQRDSRPHRSVNTPRAARENAAWTAASQTLTLLAGSVLTVLLARSLAVNEFGAYAYAISLCSIGLAILPGGLAGLGIKALLQSDADSAQTLTAILLIRAGHAVCSYAALFAVSLTSGSSLAVGASLIALTTLLARSFEAPELWFQAHLRSRATAIVRLSIVSTMLTIRLLAFAVAPSIWVFLCVFVLEAVASGLFVTRRYFRDPHSPGFAWPGRPLLAHTWRRGLPLVFSTFANQINLRGDVLLIQIFIGSGAVASYAIATGISELAYFVPTIVMNSTLPIMLANRESGNHYEELLRRSYVCAFWGGLVVAVLLWTVGPSLIHLLFGPKYVLVSEVLRIHLIATPFVFMGAVYSKWIIAEEFLWSSFLRHGFGAAVNVALNLILIPAWGIRGAAASTVASYICSNYLATWVGSRSRTQGVYMTKAMLWPAIRVYRLRFLTSQRH